MPRKDDDKDMSTARRRNRYSPDPADINESPKFRLPEFTPGHFDLVYEMTHHREFYFAPKDGEGKEVQLSLLPELCQNGLYPILSKIENGKYGRSPGLQPALASCICYGIVVISNWTETVQLQTAIDRRNNLPLTIDGNVLEMIDKYLWEIKIPTTHFVRSAPKIKLNNDLVGDRLQELATALKLPCSTVGALAATAAVVDQPNHVNIDHQRTLATYLDLVRQRFLIQAWGAAALLDALERSPISYSRTQIRTAKGPLQGSNLSSRRRPSADPDQFDNVVPFDAGHD